MCAQLVIILLMLKYVWDQQKNELLKTTRGVCFREIVELLEQKRVLADLPHHNQAKYPNQRIYIITLRSYIYAVPYVRNKDIIFLKTIYPNRKLNKRYKEKYEQNQI